MQQYHMYIVCVCMYLKTLNLFHTYMFIYVDGIYLLPCMWNNVRHLLINHYTALLHVSALVDAAAHEVMKLLGEGNFN